MASRALTPTLAICIAGGLAAGIALARPADPAPAAPVAAAAAPTDTASPDGYGAPADDAATAPADAGAAPVAVSIADFAFAAPATVAPGAVLTVTNLDGAPHTLTADDGSFDTGTLGQGDAVGVTAPTAAGTYSFFCEIHPSMTGSVTVA